MLQKRSLANVTCQDRTSNRVELRISLEELRGSKGRSEKGSTCQVCSKSHRLCALTPLAKPWEWESGLIVSPIRKAGLFKADGWRTRLPEPMTDPFCVAGLAATS